jgi:hypothetical protein
MTKRYHVAPAPQLEAIRVALDQANGLRDSAGNPTPRQCRIFKDGVDVSGTVHDPATHGFPVLTTDTIQPAIVVGGQAALELPAVPEVDAHLGTTIHGTALPPGAGLVTIGRPRDNNLLPPQITALLDVRDTGTWSDAERVAELGAARARAVRRALEG